MNLETLWDDRYDDEFESQLKKLVQTGIDPMLKEDDPALQEKFDDVVSVLKKQTDQQSVPYNRISKIIFQLSDTDGMDFFIPKLKTLVEEYISTDSATSSIRKRLVKIVRHIELSNIQMESLYKRQMVNITELSSGVDTLNGSYAEMQGSLKREASLIEERFSTKVDSMYSSFISVLGIFIAISFSLFGAATLLKNIFTISTEKGFNVSPQVIGANISLAGFATILIYLLIIGLVQGISTLTNKQYFFSLRKLFVVIGVAGGVIVSGYLYGHSAPSWTHMLLSLSLLLAYLAVWMFIYSKGTVIKMRLITLSNKKHN